MAAQPPERISGLNVARYLTDSLRGSVLTLRARHEVPSCTGGWVGGWVVGDLGSKLISTQVVAEVEV